MLLMFVMLALVADKFVMDAVVIEVLLKEAFVEICKVLLMFVMLAFVADKFVMDAVVIEALLKEAFVEI